MDIILQEIAIDKLPTKELTTKVETCLGLVLMQLPEKRLREVAKLTVQGIIGGQSPFQRSPSPIPGASLGRLPRGEMHPRRAFAASQHFLQ